MVWRSLVKLNISGVRSLSDISACNYPTNHDVLTIHTLKLIYFSSNTLLDMSVC